MYNNAHQYPKKKRVTGGEIVLIELAGAQIRSRRYST